MKAIADSTMKRPALLYLLLLAICLLPYLHSLTPLHIRWTTSEGGYQHGYVVLAVCVWAFYSKRDWIFARTQLQMWGFLPLFASSTLWFVGNITQTDTIIHMGVFLILCSWLLLAFGIHTVYRCLPLLAMLSLTLPVWDILAYPLRVLATGVCQFLLGLLNIPALVEGFTIVIPQGNFVVAGSCSGLNFLLMGCMVGLYYGFQNFQRWPLRLVAFLAVVVFSLAANWLRIFILVLIGYYSDMQSSLVHDHEGFGWIVFAVAIFLYLWLMSKIPLEEPIAEPEAPSARSAKILPLVMLSLVGTWLVPLASYYYQQAAQSQSWRLSLDGIEQWTVVEPQAPAWMPGYTGYDGQQLWRFNQGVAELSGMSLNWLQQYQGKEMVYYSHTAWPQGASNVVEETVAVDATGDQVRRAQFRSHTGQYIVWWVYRVGDSITIDPGRAKFLQLANVMSDSTVASFIMVSGRCKYPSCSDVLALEDKAVSLLLQLARAGRSED